MTSYERVRRAVHFEKPDRLPMRFREYGVDDFFFVARNEVTTGDRNLKNTVDWWGCTWSRSDVPNMGLVTAHPLEDWDALDTYVWPDPDDERLYEGMAERFASSNDRYILTSIFALLFERMHHLHGFENTLMDLYLEREKLEYLADRIVYIQVRTIQNISKRFPGMIHGLSFTDDWGTEQATFISCELFEDFFVPRYRKIFTACKEAGWDIWMHSCGKINDFIPYLIDLGVDAINMFQPVTNGIEEIGKRFAGKICFYTCCDIQKTLITGTDEEIEAEAKQLIDQWGTDDGGFICYSYGATKDIGSTIEKKQVMFDAFVRYDRWKNKKDCEDK